MAEAACQTWTGRDGIFYSTLEQMNRVLVSISFKMCLLIQPFYRDFDMNLQLFRKLRSQNSVCAFKHSGSLPWGVKLVKM